MSLLSVGAVKTPFLREGCAMYLKRLAPLGQMRVDVIAPGDPQEENARILKRLHKIDDVIVVLDERGTTMPSEKFASWLQVREQAGQHVTFVIGGAYGLIDDVRTHADLLLSLTPMTLPHELAQLLLFEQLYRGLSMLHGGKYHHGASL